MKWLNVLSLFDGDSCGRLGFEEAGIKVNKYYSSEIDPYPIKVSDKNHPEDTINRLGDVTRWREWGIDWGSIDIVIGGSPCQDLSGLKSDGKGLDGEQSKLFFEFLNIINHVKKYNPNVKFMLENVVPKKKEWKADIDRLLGVFGEFINSDLFVQQNRPRYYWTNFTYGELPTRPKWEGSYFQWRRTYYRENKSGVCPCLTANMGTGGHNVPLKSMDKKDKLTPEECEKLQGMPEGYTAGVSNSRRYKMVGNGWTIPVIAHIFKGLKKYN